MQVISTVKGLESLAAMSSGLLNWLFDFNLDGDVIDVELFSDQSICLSHDRLLLTAMGVLDGQMGCEDILLLSHGEHVEVVHILQTLDPHQDFSDLIQVNILWGSLKKEQDALPEGKPGGPQDNKGEQVGTERINIPEVWEEVDCGGGNDDSNRVQHVSKDVEVGCLNIEVPLLLSLLLVSFGVSVVTIAS